MSSRCWKTWLGLCLWKHIFFTEQVLLEFPLQCVPVQRSVDSWNQLFFSPHNTTPRWFEPHDVQTLPRLKSSSELPRPQRCCCCCCCHRPRGRDRGCGWGCCADLREKGIKKVFTVSVTTWTWLFMGRFSWFSKSLIAVAPVQKDSHVDFRRLVFVLLIRTPSRGARQNLEKTANRNAATNLCHVHFPVQEERNYGKVF